MIMNAPYMYVLYNAHDVELHFSVFHVFLVVETTGLELCCLIRIITVLIALDPLYSRGVYFNL